MGSSLDGNIQRMVEVKNGDHSIHASLKYFHDKYNIPGVQVIKELKHEKLVGGLELRRGISFLRSLYL